jgi:hypothetical protein
MKVYHSSKLYRKQFALQRFFLIIPFGFLFWYQFLFDNWRKAQDAGVQLSRLLGSTADIASPLLRLLESALNVLFLAWVVPFYNHYLNGRLSQISFAMIFTAGAILVVLFAEFYLVKASKMAGRCDCYRFDWNGGGTITSRSGKSGREL